MSRPQRSMAEVVGGGRRRAADGGSSVLLALAGGVRAVRTSTSMLRFPLLLLLLLQIFFNSCIATNEELSRSGRGFQTKNFFGGVWGNRPPSHDSPPSACSCSCGDRNDASRIVGGQEAGLREFPWMARLTYFNKFYCGGAIISDRYVLTAAHCVKGFMWFMIRVTFGEHDRCNESKLPETRFVLRAIIHDFSFSNFDNDIALLRLNERLPISDILRPLCLPTDQKNLYVGTSGVITGWGTLKEDGKPSCTLQEVSLPVMSNEECHKTNYSKSTITDNMMCAGFPKTGGKDSCQGDSGGPMAAQRPDGKYEAIGVVSWGNGCARKGYPGVYARITRYLPWIKEHTTDSCFCTD